MIRLAIYSAALFLMLFTCTRLMKSSRKNESLAQSPHTNNNAEDDTNPSHKPHTNSDAGDGVDPRQIHTCVMSSLQAKSLAQSLTRKKRCSV